MNLANHLLLISAATASSAFAFVDYEHCHRALYDCDLVAEVTPSASTVEPCLTLTF
jgi:hypothetical protein